MGSGLARKYIATQFLKVKSDVADSNAVKKRFSNGAAKR